MNELINQQLERIAELEHALSNPTGLQELICVEQMKDIPLVEIHRANQMLHEKLESAEQRVKELEAAVLEEIENRDNREEWLDKICDEIARFFGVDIGEHSSASNPWMAAFEAIPVDTLNKFAIEQQLSIMKAVDITYMAHEKGGEPISFYSAFLIVLEQLRAKLGDE